MGLEELKILLISLGVAVIVIIGICKPSLLKRIGPALILLAKLITANKE